MSVEGIVERIISDANKEAGKIIQDAKEKAKSILEEDEKEADDYYKKKKILLDEKYKRGKERMILNKRLEMRKALLKTRQNWMNKAFDGAYEKLLNQPISEYKAMMISLISKLSTSKDEEIIFGKDGDQKELKDIVKTLNSSIDGKFTLSKDRSDFQWGFILRRGKIETNMSIDSTFNYKRMDLEQKAWEIFNAGL